MPHWKHGADVSLASVKMFGKGKLLLQFDALATAVGTKVLTQAALAGAAPILNEARDGAPRGDTGILKRELRARPIATGPNSVEVAISWRAGRSSRTPAFYGLFVHEGTKSRARKSGGRTGRISRRNPFLTRAFDQRKDEAARITKRVYVSALRRAASRG